MVSIFANNILLQWIFAPANKPLSLKLEKKKKRRQLLCLCDTTRHHSNKVVSVNSH